MSHDGIHLTLSFPACLKCGQDTKWLCHNAIHTASHEITLTFFTSIGLNSYSIIVNIIGGLIGDKENNH